VNVTMSGLHYKKDGSLDMRYSSSRQAMSSSGGSGSQSHFSGFSGPSYSASSSSSGSGLHGSLDMSYSSSKQTAAHGVGSGYGSASSYPSGSDSGLHYKKDGSLDMRYSSSRQAVSSAGGHGSHSSGISGPSYSPSSSSSGSGLHFKKDGSLDMRYSSSKQAALSGVGSGDGSASSYSKQAAGLTDNFRQMNVNEPSSGLHYKKDGSLDMRYRSSKQEMCGTTAGSKPTVQQKSYGIPGYVPKKKDGTPDMRTKAAKDWVASEASKCISSDLPAWVPMKKDGSVDLTTAIGRTFAGHGRRKVQHREDYWHSRLEDDLFRMLVESQRQMSVPDFEPTPIFVTPCLRNECRGQSGFTESLETTMPDSIPQIDYSSIKITTDESSELGRGSFGVVLKGEWNYRDVAVKKLHLDMLTSKEKDSFRKEIIILANLGMHPNLVKLHGYCLNPPCIVMELVQRGSLSYLLHYCDDPDVEAKMTDGRIKKQLVFGIVDGMRQLHASQIVHGDLKPQNVLVTTDYVAKITDFGLSTLRGKSSSTVASRQFGEDDEERVNVGGTAGYMAPELLDSTSPPDYSSDVFSFGVILNEVICEEEPYADQYANFAGRGPFGAANYAKLGKRPTISDSTPSAVKQVIERCWGAEPKTRPSFEEISCIIKSAMFIIPNSIY